MCAAYERISSSARGSGERRPRVSAMVTGKKVRYVAMMTTDVDPATERHDQDGRQRDDRDRLADDDKRQDRPLCQGEMDEDGRERDADERPEREADERLTPRVERGLDQVAEEGQVGVPLERIQKGARDRPQVGQLDVGCLQHREGRLVVVVGTGAEDVGQPPWIAEEPLDGFPHQTHDHEEDDEDRDAPERPGCRRESWADLCAAGHSPRRSPAWPLDRRGRCSS